MKPLPTVVFYCEEISSKKKVSLKKSVYKKRYPLKKVSLKKSIFKKKYLLKKVYLIKKKKSF